MVGIPLAKGGFYPLLSWQLSPIYAAAAVACGSVFIVCSSLGLRGLRLTGVAPATAAGGQRLRRPDRPGRSALLRLGPGADPGRDGRCYAGGDGATAGGVDEDTPMDSSTGHKPRPLCLMEEAAGRRSVAGVRPFSART